MGDKLMHKPLVVVVSGPSGVGKSTICREVARRMNDVYLSVSMTTRPKGPGEADGQDYRYITKDEFQERIEKGKFLEWAEVFGNLYGTPRDDIERALSAGKAVIVEIDVQGGKQVKAEYGDAVMIFILAPTQRELAERMARRAREDEKAAQSRLEQAGSEIAAAWQYYKYMVINEDLSEAVNEVVQIIKGARLQRRRQGSFEKESE